MSWTIRARQWNLSCDHIPLVIIIGQNVFLGTIFFEDPLIHFIKCQYINHTFLDANRSTMCSYCKVGKYLVGISSSTIWWWRYGSCLLSNYSPFDRSHNNRNRRKIYLTIPWRRIDFFNNVIDSQVSDPR